MKRWLTGLLLAGYLLGVYRGYVAVWRYEDPEPWLVTDTPAALLPERDARELARGRALEGDQALTKALEDYCS